MEITRKMEVTGNELMPAGFLKAFKREWLGETIEEDALGVYGWLVGNLMVKPVEYSVSTNSVKLEIGISDPENGKPLAYCWKGWIKLGGSITCENPPEGAFVVAQRVRLSRE